MRRGILRPGSVVNETHIDQPGGDSVAPIQTLERVDFFPLTITEKDRQLIAKFQLT